MSELPTNEEPRNDEKEEMRKKKVVRCYMCFYKHCITRREDYTGPCHIFQAPKTTCQQLWIDFFKKLPPDFLELKELKEKKHVLCSLHFEDRFIIKSQKYVVDGKTYEVPFSRWRLTQDAYPTLLDPRNKVEGLEGFKTKMNCDGSDNELGCDHEDALGESTFEVLKTSVNAVQECEVADEGSETSIPLKLNGHQDVEGGDNEIQTDENDSLLSGSSEPRDVASVRSVPAVESPSFHDMVDLNDTEVSSITDKEPHRDDESSRQLHTPVGENSRERTEYTSTLNDSVEECDGPDKIDVEFYVNASKNVPKECGSNDDSSNDDIQIVCDNKQPNFVPLTGARKRKQTFVLVGCQPKKPKSVEVIDLDSDSEDNSKDSQIIDVSQKGSILKRAGTVRGTAVLQNVLQCGQSDRKQPGSVILVPQSRNLISTPQASISGPVVLVSAPILRPQNIAPALTLGNAQPLGNTGTNFVIIRPTVSSTSAVTEKTVRPLTASDMSLLVMPTADWNVNTYAQGFSISETIMSQKCIEIIRRSITISNMTWIMKFSVFAQNVTHFSADMAVTSVPEIQQVLNRFSSVPICAGLDLDALYPKPLETSSDVQGKLYRHVDHIYRSLACPLVLINPTNHPLQSNTWLLPQKRPSELCEACSGAKNILEKRGIGR